MNCPACNYLMSDLDVSCPRCHGKGVPAAPPVLSQTSMQAAPPTVSGERMVNLLSFVIPLIGIVACIILVLANSYERAKRVGAITAAGLALQFVMWVVLHL